MSRRGADWFLTIDDRMTAHRTAADLVQRCERHLTGFKPGDEALITNGGRYEMRVTSPVVAKVVVRSLARLNRVFS